jgi:hypothetical protein
MPNAGVIAERFRDGLRKAGTGNITDANRLRDSAWRSGIIDMTHNQARASAPMLAFLDADVIKLEGAAISHVATSLGLRVQHVRYNLVAVRCPLE